MKTKYRGIICILLSAFCFALMNVFVRLSGDLPSIQKSFFRNLVAMIFAFVILKSKHTPISVKKENLGIMLLRSICGTIGILCNFYAVDHLVLADASMLNKLSPFFVIICSFIFLKERINWVQTVAVIVAFIGTLCIIKPSFSNTAMMPALIGSPGGLGAGAAYTCVRYLGNHGEKGPMIVFFFSTFSCAVTLPYLIFSFTPMSLLQICVLLLAGLAAAGGQFSITAAYSYAPASEISVYDYSQIVFSAFLGFFLFGQIPDVLSIVGYLCICGMAVFMFLYNGRIQAKLKAEG